MRVVIDKKFAIEASEEDKKVLKSNTVWFKEINAFSIEISEQKIDLFEEDMADIITIFDDGSDKFIYLRPYESNRYKLILKKEIDE